MIRVVRVHGADANVLQLVSPELLSCIGGIGIERPFVVLILPLCEIIDSSMSMTSGSDRPIVVASAVAGVKGTELLGSFCRVANKVNCNLKLFDRAI